MMKRVAKILFAGCLALVAMAAAGTVAPAHAERLERTQHSVTVRIDRAGVMRGDVDAVDEAHGVILRAARRVCGLSGSRRLTLRERRDGQACLQDTVEQTVAGLASPYLANAFARLLGPERLARLEWGTPQIITFARDLPAGEATTTA